MKRLRVGKYVLPALAVVTLLGTVGVAKSLGAWQTSGRGQILLDERGQPDPAGIKGWMTLSDVAENYGVPLDDLKAMIGAGADVPASTAMKDLERLVPGTEVWAVRELVAAYLNGTSVGGLDAGSKDASPAATAAASGQDDHGQGQRGAAIPAGGVLPGAEIKGWMTLADVVDLCNVPVDYLLAEAGLPASTDMSVPLRELASAAGVEVGLVREVVDRYQWTQ